MTFMKLHSGFFLFLLQHCVNYFIAMFISLIISEVLLVVSYHMCFVLDNTCLNEKKRCSCMNVCVNKIMSSGNTLHDG